MKDLFTTPEKLPMEILTILDNYNLESMSYVDCQNMLAEMEEKCYTFEFGLDAIPFNLQISKIHLLKAIKQKSNFFAEQMKREIDDLTNELDHVNASVLSRVGSRLDLFISELNEFELKN